MRTSSRLTVENLNLILDKFHLQDISLEVMAGEYFVLLGPTGAGKTVLLETIAGIKQQESGKVFVDGKDIRDWPPERRGIGFVYQDYALFPHLNVRQNIAFGLNLMGKEELFSLVGEGPGPEQRQSGGDNPGKTDLINRQVAWISELTRTRHLLDRKPAGLSGGEKQRVALARALVIQPRLLFLDEPLSALDPENREKLQEELKRIQDELGITTVHITHNFEEAVALADRVGVIFGGKILQTGSPQEVFRQPADESVARFVGVRNILPGTIKEGTRGGEKNFSTSGFDLFVISDRVGKASASIRPEDIILSRKPLQSSARNSFSGVVRDLSDRGPIVYVSLEISPEGEGEAARDPLYLTSLVTNRSLQEMGLEPGVQVYLAFKSSALHII